MSSSVAGFSNSSEFLANLPSRTRVLGWKKQEEQKARADCISTDWRTHGTIKRQSDGPFGRRRIVGRANGSTSC